MRYQLIVTRARTAKIGIWLSLCIVLFGAVQATTTYAISQDDLNSIYYNTPFYDQSAASCIDTSGTTILVGSDNVEQTFNFLSGKGLSTTAAAAIMGNLMIDSNGIIPTLLQAYTDQNGQHHDAQYSNSLPLSASGLAGYGIAAWTSTDRQNQLITKAAAEGLPAEANGLQFVGDLRAQLDFLWQEATSDTYSSVLANVRKSAASSQSDALKTATDIWMRGYEDSATAESIAARETDAAQVQSRFKDNVPINGGCGSTDFVSNFKFYKQCSYAGWVIGGLETQDERDAARAWHSAPFGGGTVCSAGCGPTSLAMAILNLTGNKDATPDKVAAYTYKVHAGDGAGSSGFGLINDVAPNYGLKGDYIGSSVSNIDEINKRLAEGDLILMRGHMESVYYQSESTPYGPFSVGGHFVIIRGYKDGKWLIGNPGGWPDKLEYDPAWIYAHTTVHDAWWISKA